MQTIGVPSGIYDILVNEWATGLNFVETLVPELGLSLYALDGACPVDVLSWPDIDLTWAASDIDGNAFTQTLSVPPTVYLNTNSAMSKCVMMVTSVSEAPNGCWLGAPFFRNYQIIFNYYQNAVTLFSKDVQSPVDNSSQPFDEDILKYTFDRNEDGLYTYRMALGSPIQRSSGIGFSTSSAYTIVPSEGCPTC